MRLGLVGLAVDNGRALFFLVFKDLGLLSQQSLILFIFSPTFNGTFLLIKSPFTLFALWT